MTVNGSCTNTCMYLSCNLFWGISIILEVKDSPKVCIYDIKNLPIVADYYSAYALIFRSGYEQISPVE